MNLEGPAKHQPKTSTVEDEDEWEDALVVSYVPQPIAWDDHPTGRQLNKLLESVQLEQHLLPVAIATSKIKAWKQSKNNLKISIPWAPRDSLQTLERSTEGYILTQNEPIWERFTNTRSQIHISNGGKFLIIAENDFSATNVVLWRLDLADSSLHKILDVPKDKLIFANLGSVSFG